MRTRASWIWLAFLLPIAVDFTLDRAIERLEAGPPVGMLEASVDAEAEPAPAPAHGAYCAPQGGQTQVFFGRDLPQLTTYAQFEQWCDFQNGDIGWAA